MSIYSLPREPSPSRFKPQCTHLTMTRVYGFTLNCDACHRPGPFGWVYRCTQDREDLIENVLTHGQSASFDELGNYMAQRVSVRPRSPAARADTLSFFDEITHEELSYYRPSQVQMILRQREAVHLAIANEKLREVLDARQHSPSVNGRPYARSSSENSRPWVPTYEHECQYMVCPYCRPGAADRSFLSLGGVANGAIQPTSAVGFGFHIMGERPVVDADILRSISCRPVPLARKVPGPEHASSESTISIMAMLEDQLAKGHSNLAKEHAAKIFPRREIATRSSSVLPKLDAGSLKHSPRCENLAVFVGPKEIPSHGSSIRPPWTPPPSPSPYGQETATETHSLGLAAEKSISSGRSSNSLKTNPSVRHQMLRSVPSASALDRIDQSAHASPRSDVPYMPESEYDVGLTLPFNQGMYELACMTPLEPRGVSDPRQHSRPAHLLPREEETKPIPVDHGVAMMEESLELGVPDVVTQV